MEIDKNRVAKNITNLDKTYKLSALINVDSFFYALFDHDSLLFSKQIKLSEQESHTLFDGAQVTLSKVFIGWSTERYTLIPSDEYDNNVRSKYLEHATGTPPTNHVFADYNSIARVHICYDISQELYERFSKLSHHVQFNHIVSALLDSVMKEKHKTLIHVCKIGSQAILIFLIDGKLQMVTNLRSSSPMHVLYYTNLVRKQFDKKEKDIQIELSGDFQSVDGTLRLLNKYFSQVNYKECALMFNNAGMKSSVHYPLKSIVECA